MSKTITKGLLGLEDLNFGAGTFSRSTSTGGTITLHQINSSNVGSGFPLQGQTTPSGAVNGVNTIFTLASTPGMFVFVYRNGILQNPGVSNDYTISGITITFNVAPPSGDVITAIY